MGYTNYFYVKKNIPAFDDRFVKEAEAAIDIYNRKHPEEAVYLTRRSPTCIAIDKGPGVTHEYLIISLLPDEWEPKDRDYIFGCCKTRMDTYDVIVKAVIMIAAKYGIVTGYSADGDDGEEELAKEAQAIFDETEGWENH